MSHWTGALGRATRPRGAALLSAAALALVSAAGPARVMADEAPAATASSAQREVRMVPHYESGAVVGVKIFRVRAGSPFYDVGLRNGDIILRIGGASAADVEVVRDMYDNVMAGDVLEMAVNRHGETVILNPVVD